jgi:hypothetical protein
MPFLIWAIRCRSCGWKIRGERGGSPAKCFSGEAVLEVVDGGLPVVNGGEGLVYGMRGFSVMMRVRSARSNSYCGEVRARLEMTVASGVIGDLDSQRYKARY